MRYRFGWGASRCSDAAVHRDPRGAALPQEGSTATIVRLLRQAGPLAVACAWAVLAISVHADPGYRFLGHSLSDLGAASAPHPALYNDGLMVTGGLIVLYGIALAALARQRVGVAGATLFALDGVFLACIGLFHEGTPPHVFLSLWFFVEASLAAALWGLGHLHAPGWLVAYEVVGPGALALGLWLPFPSTAYRELFGVAAVDAFGLISYLETRTWGLRAPRHCSTSGGPTAHGTTRGIASNSAWR